MKCYLDTTWKANINSVNIYGGAVRDESVESCLLDTCKQVRGKMYTFIHGNENYEKIMIWMKYLLGARHFHLLFVWVIIAGWKKFIYYVYFYQMTKTEVLGKLIESDLVHHLWATKQRSMEAWGIPGNTIGDYKAETFLILGLLGVLLLHFIVLRIKASRTLQLQTRLAMTERPDCGFGQN